MLSGRRSPTLRHFDEGCLLVNGLGTTETGLVRQFFLAPDDPISGPLLPIGRAVEDMEVQLLDESGQAVEIGAIGEIAVASRYLALGYWQRPELTSAAFQPDPADPEARICTKRNAAAIHPRRR